MTQSSDAGNAAALQQPPPLRVSRTFHARRELVFKAWCAAEHVRNWFSPRTYSVADATVEMRVGGAFDVCMLSPSGERHWTRGKFVEVTPHSRLVIDMHATDLQGRKLFRAYTEVTFTDAVAGATTMDVVQTYTFVDPAMAAPMVAGAAEGWRTTLDKLDQELLRLPGDDADGVGMLAAGPGDGLVGRREDLQRTGDVQQLHGVEGDHFDHPHGGRRMRGWQDWWAVRHLIRPAVAQSFSDAPSASSRYAVPCSREPASS
jgi:uncharacterized protein YndB with AHSA1/START domain